MERHLKLKPVKLFNRTLSLMLAALLLIVAGSRSSFDGAGFSQKSVSHSTEFGKQPGKSSKPADANESKISTLSLDAVITPAISFDFSQYFYFIPQPVWQFVVHETAIRFSYQESFFLVSYFHKVFGRFIVTNAP